MPGRNQKRFVVVGNGKLAERLAAEIEKNPNLTLLQLIDDDCARRDGLMQVSKRPFDWLFTFNSLVVIPEEVIAEAREGALNMHPGPLPEYAGVYTHYWAVEECAKEFGATVHYMIGQVDAGDIIAQERFTVGRDDKPATLFMKSMFVGLSLACKVIGWIGSGEELPRETQDLTKRRLYTLKQAREKGWHE